MSTNGGAPSTCARSSAASTTRCTATGSGSSGKGWRRSPTTAARCLIANHAGAIPVRCPGHHARHRGGVGAAGLRHGRLLLQDHPGGRDHVVPDRGGARPPGQRLPAPPRPAAAGPGLPRGHQGHLQDLYRSVPPTPVRAGWIRRDRHEGGRAGHPHRRGRAPRSPCRSCSGSNSVARALNLPYFPVTVNSLADGPDRATSPTSRSRSSSGSSIPSPSTSNRASSGTRGAG